MQTKLTDHSEDPKNWDITKRWHEWAHLGDPYRILPWYGEDLELEEGGADRKIRE